jgi:hypothetical protein
MVAVKIVGLPKATKRLVGMPVPEQKHGNVGRLVEDLTEAEGYPINRGKGADIKQLQVEIKTRQIEATSAHTIGKLRISDIITHSWEESALYQKAQRQFRVFHSKDTLSITKTMLVDFRPEHIQSKIKESYEEARKEIIRQYQTNGVVRRYVRGKDCWGFFENTNLERPQWYDFRFSDKSMKQLENMSSNNYPNLFENV